MLRPLFFWKWCAVVHQSFKPIQHIPPLRWLLLNARPQRKLPLSPPPRSPPPRRLHARHLPVRANKMSTSSEEQQPTAMAPRRTSSEERALTSPKWPALDFLFLQALPSPPESVPITTITVRSILRLLMLKFARTLPRLKKSWARSSATLRIHCCSLSAPAPVNPCQA